MVYSTRRFVVCLSVCHFVLVFFSPFSAAIASLGEEGAGLSAFRTFVRFVLVWICRFPLSIGVWEGLRFVIVALPGLFSYLFFFFFFLSGQALKAIFKLLYHFTELSPKHVLELFDKLIKPILCYGSEVWGFSKPVQQERVHLQFCKKLLGVKKSTQNVFIYGELGRVSLQTSILYSVINYWFKILESEQRMYNKYAYKMLVTDLENRPNSINWVSKVRDLLSTLGFHEVW